MLVESHTELYSPHCKAKLSFVPKSSLCQFNIEFALVVNLARLAYPWWWVLGCTPQILKRNTMCHLLHMKKRKKHGTSDQLISKGFLMSSISSKKRTKEFDFTTMIPQVDLFSFVFWRKSKTPKNHFEIIWPLTAMFLLSHVSHLHSVVRRYKDEFPVACPWLV